jgi:opacity protein-like surface antigen
MLPDPCRCSQPGGVAWTWLELSYSDSLTQNGVTRASSDYEDSDVLTGWTVGGGAEYKLIKNASARVDVQHYRFNTSFEGDLITIGDLEVGTTVVRGGVTFHLN